MAAAAEATRLKVAGKRGAGVAGPLRTTKHANELALELQPLFRGWIRSRPDQSEEPTENVGAPRLV
jgi:hypothetical protein